ncbi:flexible cuticle protein 12-like [Plodia interpunctella]|uniref:flexible cuticle protein 12-like n=1 Tax=Plodia interpunctella TaxID=58824 RepID=UPI002368A786|nr:flexible cuticle protein 12-like [Plodia interpunctella]
MRTCLVFALCVAVASAAAISDSKNAVIVRSDLENIGVDGYKYGYETSDGKSANEEGQLKNVGTQDEAMEVRGQFSYTGADGQVYTVTYVANELGFQPQGAHLPKAA